MHLKGKKIICHAKKIDEYSFVILFPLVHELYWTNSAC